MYAYNFFLKQAQQEKHKRGEAGGGNRLDLMIGEIWKNGSPTQNDLTE
jgi:hypothetical protein